MSEPRFEYARAKTRERAESILEDCFANGEVSEGERPLIEARRDHNGKTLYWAVTLPM